MDAVKFIKNLRRMCNAHDNCVSCPARDCACQSLENMVKDTMIVAIVEEWSAAHPRKTRQDVFLEQYPETQIADNGVLGVCPAPIFHSHRTDGGGCIDINRKCTDCRREFWMQEVE
nr:MAG TPA: hypothetical protein [Caudoviricetes sp.]